jgi:hypothetical protein
MCCVVIYFVQSGSGKSMTSEDCVCVLGEVVRPAIFVCADRCRMLLMLSLTLKSVACKVL